MTGWHWPSSQAVLSVLAMLGLLGLAFIMSTVETPHGNHDFLVFILGALAGAITSSGAKTATTARGDVNVGGKETVE